MTMDARTVRSYERGAALVPLCRQLGTTVEGHELWRVPSASSPKVGYVVRIKDGVRGPISCCDCPAGQAVKPCKHVAAVVMARAQRMEVTR